MIVSFDDLISLRHEVTMVDGAFDPLHAGHIEYFRAASQFGLPVLCNVASDRYVRTKHAPLLTEDQRVVVIDAVRYIQYTHINEINSETVLQQLMPKYFVKGKDWEGRLPLGQVEICQALGIRIVYVDTVLNSSTRILKTFAADHAAGSAKAK